MQKGVSEAAGKTFWKENSSSASRSVSIEVEIFI